MKCDLFHYKSEKMKKWHPFQRVNWYSERWNERGNALKRLP